MSIRTGRTKFFVIAMAISAAWPLTIAPPAQANPCENYQFHEGLTIKQDNNLYVGFANPAASTFNNVYAHYEVNGFGNEITSGHANGSVTGTSVDITVNWDRGPGAGLSNHYTGVVNADGTGQGMSVNSKGSQNVWATAPQKFSCAGG
ncbi:MAG TPA: hypothetical protein VIO95_08250 [Mycobacterium sp.]